MDQAEAEVPNFTSNSVLHGVSLSASRLLFVLAERWFVSALVSGNVREETLTSRPARHPESAIDRRRTSALMRSPGTAHVTRGRSGILDRLFRKVRPETRRRTPPSSPATQRSR